MITSCLFFTLAGGTPVGLTADKPTKNAVTLTWKAPAAEEGTIDFFIVNAKGGEQDITRTVPKQQIETSTIAPTTDVTTAAATTPKVTQQSNAQQALLTEAAQDTTTGFQPGETITYLLDGLYPSTTYEINVYTKNKQPEAPQDELVGEPAHVQIITETNSKC